MADKVIIRIPVLENLATQYGDAFAKESRFLTSHERTIALTVFEQSVNLNVVKIVTTNVINAPTTLGNNIRIPPGYSLSDATLIHELTHVWQFQTKGNSYISDSAVHQAAGVLTSRDRNAAYQYNIVPGQSIYRYTAEQQAMIVENYFRYLTLQADKEYKRMIAEVRRTRPVLTNMDRYQESLYGSGYRNRSLMDSLQTPNDRQGGTVPIIRFEF